MGISLKGAERAATAAAEARRGRVQSIAAGAAKGRWKGVQGAFTGYAIEE